MQERMNQIGHTLVRYDPLVVVVQLGRILLRLVDKAIPVDPLVVATCHWRWRPGKRDGERGTGMAIGIENDEMARLGGEDL